MRIQISCLFAALLLAPAAFADKGEGQAFYEPTLLETVELADGRVLSRVKVSGFVIGSNEKNPFHMVNQHCSGTSILTTGQSEPTAYGYCEGVDRDGDVFFMAWTTGPAGNTWQLLGGTGKFDGISGGGTSATTQAWTDGKYVIDWDGSWKMK
jgi:hypothetical protein